MKPTARFYGQEFLKPSHLHLVLVDPPFSQPNKPSVGLTSRLVENSLRA